MEMNQVGRNICFRSLLTIGGLSNGKTLAKIIRQDKSFYHKKLHKMDFFKWMNAELLSMEGQTKMKNLGHSPSINLIQKSIDQINSNRVALSLDFDWPHLALTKKYCKRLLNRPKDTHEASTSKGV